MNEKISTPEFSAATFPATACFQYPSRSECGPSHVRSHFCIISLPISRLAFLKIKDTFLREFLNFSIPSTLRYHLPFVSIQLRLEYPLGESPYSPFVLSPLIVWAISKYFFPLSISLLLGPGLPAFLPFLIWSIWVQELLVTFRPSFSSFCLTISFSFPYLFFLPPLPTPISPSPALPLLYINEHILTNRRNGF